METTAYEIARTDDFDITSLDSRIWDESHPIQVCTYWSGEPAPRGRCFEARLLWSPTALYVRFEANQAEPLVVSADPDTGRKTNRLWDRDVCEIFIAPYRSNPNKYFEFEIAPTGEWIDIGLEITPSGRIADWDYASGMEPAARIEEGLVMMGIRIPFASLGGAPEPGEVWLGNLFRCVGSGPDRGYLAWQPTRTEKPGFHVPEAFGELRFV